MTLVEQMASFVVRSSYDDISEGARQDLKIRVLDSLGCAIGALDEGPVNLIKNQVEDFGGSPLCTLIGSGEEPRRIGRHCSTAHSILPGLQRQLSCQT